MMKALKMESPAEQSRIFSAIRGGFSYVAQNASLVEINHDTLAGYARSLPDTPPENVFDDTHHFSGTDEETSNFVITLDAINFGSGFEPEMAAEGWDVLDGSIYFTLASALKSHYLKHGPIPAETLRTMPLTQTAALLRLNLNRSSHFEFARLCTLSVRELGALITDEYQGSFTNLVESACGQAHNLVTTLTGLKSFRDIHPYQGQNIPFYKRAQITAADLHLAFAKKGITLFEDIEDVTMFPDNMVPHVLRVDGILSYTPELAARIDSSELIKSGSPEEIEIRACAGHVVECLALEKNMKAMDIDHILWHRGTENTAYHTGKMLSHMTRSSFY